MRKYGRIDSNHRAICAALRQVGASVQDLSPIGDGCPDILVGFQGVDYKCEIKDGSKSASRRKLRPLQVKWHENWRGSKTYIIEGVDEALALVTKA